MGDYGNAMARNSDAGVQPRMKGPSRSNVLQLKLMGQNHPTGLTANLLKLFEPRPPLPYRAPLEKPKLPAYTGIAQFVSQFVEPGDHEYAPPVTKGETRTEKKARIHQLKLEQGAAKVAEELQKYVPLNDPNATGDPYKTLFVGRLSYETSECKIKKEFEAYGPIKRVRLVTDEKKGKPRGYAFVEYMHTRDMKNAYKQADGRKVDNKRVVVDVERGRTVPNWRPRRLGGGLGSSRMGGEGAEHKRVAREQQLAGRPRSEEPRRDNRRAFRDREKFQEMDHDERTHEHSHDRTRNRELRGERRNRSDRDRIKDKNQERDKERDHGRDRERNRHGRDKHRDPARDQGERERSRDHHNRGRDRDERAGHQSGRHHLHDRDMADYGQEHDYNQYEQRESHDAYGHVQDGHGHQTGRSKRHEQEYHQEGHNMDSYQVRPNDTEERSP